MDLILPGEGAALRFAILRFAAAVTADPPCVVAPVLHYLNVDCMGKYAKAPEGSLPAIDWKLGYICIPGYSLHQLLALPDENQTVYDIDIVMQTRGNVPGYAFNRVSPRARWKQNAELMKEVERGAAAMSAALIDKLSGKPGIELFENFGEAQEKLKRPAAIAQDDVAEMEH